MANNSTDGGFLGGLVFDQDWTVYALFGSLGCYLLYRFLRIVCDPNVLLMTVEEKSLFPPEPPFPLPGTTRLSGNEYLNAYCLLCRRQYWEDDEITVLPDCAHAFHQACMGIWLEDHSCCPKPNCRRELEHRFPRLRAYRQSFPARRSVVV